MSAYDPWRENVDPRELDALVGQAQAGDHLAWEKLIARTTPVARKVVRSVVRPDEVDDVVQDVYVRVLGNIGQYRGSVPGHFTAWLAVVSRNVALDHVRRDRTSLRQEQPFGTASEHQAYLDAIAAPEPGPDLDVVDRVQEAIDSLSGREREMVILHYLTGYSYKGRRKTNVSRKGYTIPTKGA